VTEKTGSQPSAESIAGQLGYREIPEALAAADLPIARGHHLALAIGRGAGEDAVYTMAVARLCETGTPAQALILTPSRDRAVELSLSMQRGLSPCGMRVAVPRVRSDGSLEAEASAVECLVERPSLLLPEVRLGRLHVGRLRLLVIDGLADLEDIEEWASAEPILDTLGGEVKRILRTRRVDDSLHEIVQRQLPRARRWPEEAFGRPEESGEAGTRLPIDVGTAPTGETRLSLLLHAVRGRAPAAGVRVRCRSESDIPWVAAALEGDGWEVGGVDGWDVAAAPAGGDDGGSGERTADRPLLVWFGLPLSAEGLREPADGDRVAIVDPAHVAQMSLLAARVSLEPRLLAGPGPAEELDPIGRFRNRVRVRARKGGIDAELLVLEPLLREFGSVRVAAALSDMLRRSGAGDAGVRPWPDVEAASLSPRAPAGREARVAPEHRGVRGAWSRVFIGIGSRDAVRAGDIVGAITGETGIAGAQVGKIDIRTQFTLVEVDSQVVDRVIRKLNGATIRGRTVTVKPDRGG